MAYDVIEAPAVLQMARGIFHERFQHLGTCSDRLLATKKAVVYLCEKIRCLVSSASQHHAIDMGKMLVCFIQVGDATVEDDGQVGARLLEAIDACIV